MPSQIHFFGDTTLNTAASYLAGVITHAGWTFDYVPSDQPAELAAVQEGHQLTIVSDYPAVRMSQDVQTRICEQVRAGAGLLMIGGWESFQGSDGHWHGTTLSQILPVQISEEDDRRNCDSPVFIVKETEHPILEGLPWTERTPVVGGYNAVTAKPDAELLLSARRYSAHWNDNAPELSESGSDPLLVVSECNEGRVAALMTDLAPHWVGPLVDWGDDRVPAQAARAEAIEVGDLYARFVKQLLNWLGRLDSE